MLNVLAVKGPKVANSIILHLSSYSVPGSEDCRGDRKDESDVIIRKRTQTKSGINSVVASPYVQDSRRGYTCACFGTIYGEPGVNLRDRKRAV